MWLDASASHATPPAGVAADASQYGLLGARLHTDFDWGTVSLSGRLGDALAGTDGQWLQGDAAVASGTRIGKVGIRATLAGFGLRYRDPFRYDADGVELRPAVSIPAGPFILAAVPRLSFGAWRTDALEGDLEVAGGDIDIQRSFGGTTLGGSVGALSATNGVTAGTFARAAIRLRTDRGRWTATARLEGQRTPLETEVGGGLQASIRVAPGFEVHGAAGQRLRDPLFGTAGSFTFTLGATARVVGWSPPEPPPVVELGDPTPDGRRVQFAIRAPEAESVRLTGDFTRWDPIPMEARDGWWIVTLPLEPGLHHFGFLVDGEWVIPPDAPGVVEDGWGRRNASVVVEP